MMQKGPPDHATYEECSAVHECGIIMAKMVAPPRIHHYHRMQRDFAREYPECWPLQYQQDDRFRYEQFPQALHKLHAQADRQIVSVGFLVASDEESSFDLNYPFEHILWSAVNARWACKWWQDNFIRHEIRFSMATRGPPTTSTGTPPSQQIEPLVSSLHTVVHQPDRKGEHRRQPRTSSHFAPQLFKREKKRKRASVAANDATTQHGRGTTPIRGVPRRTLLDTPRIIPNHRVIRFASSSKPANAPKSIPAGKPGHIPAIPPLRAYMRVSYVAG